MAVKRVTLRRRVLTQSAARNLAGVEINPYPYGGPNGLASYEATVGRPIRGPIQEGHSRGTSWTGWLNNLGTILDGWAPRCAGSSASNRLMVTLRPYPDPAGGYSLAQAATGAYNENYRAAAQLIQATGYASSIILRPMHELNGNWYDWGIYYSGNGGVDTAAANFVATWRHMVTTMRTVIPNLTFDWNLAFFGTVTDQVKAWPGAEYVSVVSMDFYDRVGGIYPPQNATTWSTAWTYKAESNPWNRVTLRWLRDWAIQQGRPLGIPEWGCVHNINTNDGGNDNPIFMENFLAWADARAAEGVLAYIIYFERDPTNEPVKHKLFNFPGGGTPVYDFATARQIYKSWLNAGP